MKTLDRIILIALVVGVWGLLGTIWLKPSNVDAHADGHTHYSFELFDVAEEGHSHEGHSHDSYDIYDFKRTVKKIVRKCFVDGGYISC